MNTTICKITNPKIIYNYIKDKNFHIITIQIMKSGENSFFHWNNKKLF